MRRSDIYSKLYRQGLYRAMDDLPFEGLRHDPPLYRERNGIKIYTGTTRYLRRTLKSGIAAYQECIRTCEESTGRKMLLSPLKPSTLTAKGKFSNVLFDEEDIIDLLAVPEDQCIIKIGCNYGEIFNVGSPHMPETPVAKKSNRGRKPKVKAKSKRKMQGTGTYFSSQITFEVYHPEYKKIYKIKLFRNGHFQVPGVSHTEMNDLIDPIIRQRDYLRGQFYDESIEVVYFISVMRNYKCSLIEGNLFVYLNKLERLLIEEKRGQVFNAELSGFLNEKYPPAANPWISTVQEYIGDTNPMNIAEIQNNCERYFGLIIKFYRPVPWKAEKKTTIKILRSGKVNFDGGNSEEEIFELYYWLQWFLLKHYDEVVYSNGGEASGSSDNESDTSGYESIYDSESDESE
jgi:hypothetical protein